MEVINSCCINLSLDFNWFRFVHSNGKGIVIGRKTDSVIVLDRTFIAEECTGVGIGLMSLNLSPTQEGSFNVSSSSYLLQRTFTCKPRASSAKYPSTTDIVC